MFYIAVFFNLGKENFQKSLDSQIFIDKSMFIGKVNNLIKTNDCFMGITKPRRFGKTMVTSMLEAYYSKECTSKKLFKNI